MAARMSKPLALFFLLSCVVAGVSAAASKNQVSGAFEISKGDFTIKSSNFGATILSVVLPDSKGNLGDVVLGYDDIFSYKVNPPYVNETYYFGALVGRVANRVGDASFTLNGIRYHLVPNDGKNELHGGDKGFSQVMWTTTEVIDGDYPYITYHYRSKDGEEGFPGDLDVHVTYKISDNYELTVNMTAQALNKPTPVNLAQHSYWNLAGEGQGTILSNSVQIFGSHITPVDEELIPTGDFKAVKDTPFDFRQPMTVGSRISMLPGGYDVNYVLDSQIECNGLRKVAVVKDCHSGRVMELSSNQPGVQFYSGNFLDNNKGKKGHIYKRFGGLALETQGFPDSVNQPNFPPQILNPGEVYNHVMVYKFSF